MAEPHTDPMISIMMDKDVIEMISTLVAKLERIAFDESRTGVFRTKWGKSLFSECMRRLTKSKPEDQIFDIDEWYSSVLKNSKSKTRRDIDASVHIQPIDTDWLMALLNMEIELSSNAKQASMFNKGGFMKILYHTLELEDRAQTKLASYCKEERQYDFLGVNMTRNTGTKLLMSAPPPKAKPGSAEDLLNSTANKK
jgi:hypothetical protein